MQRDRAAEGFADTDQLNERLHQQVVVSAIGDPGNRVVGAVRGPGIGDPDYNVVK
jgi:hypothetical protein